MSIPYTSDSQLPLFTPTDVHSDTAHNTPHQRLLANDNDLQSQITAVASSPASWSTLTGKPNLIDYTLGMYNWSYPNFYPVNYLNGIYGSTGGSYIEYPIDINYQYILGSYTSWYWQNGTCSGWPCALYSGAYSAFYNLYTTGTTVSETGNPSNTLFNFQMTVAPVAGSNWNANPNKYVSSWQTSQYSPTTWGPIDIGAVYEFNGATGSTVTFRWYKTGTYTYKIRISYVRYDSREGLSIKHFCYNPVTQAFISYSGLGTF